MVLPSVCSCQSPAILTFASLPPALKPFNEHHSKICSALQNFPSKSSCARSTRVMFASCVSPHSFICAQLEIVEQPVPLISMCAFPRCELPPHATKPYFPSNAQCLNPFQPAFLISVIFKSNTLPIC